MSIIKHNPLIEECTCNKCCAYKLGIDEKLVELSEGLFPLRSSFKYESLNIRERFFLGIIMESSLVEDDLFLIKPYKDHHAKLVPTEELLTEIYQTLLGDDIIYVDFLSSYRNLEVVDDKISFSFLNVAYNINLDYPDNKDDLRKKIKSPQYLREELYDLYLLWYEVAIASLQEHFKYYLDVYHIKPTNINSMELDFAFRKVLNEFSLSQAWYLLDKACIYMAANSKAYFTSPNVSWDLAIRKMLSIADWFNREGRSPTGYSRNLKIPVSVMEKYFFYNFTNLGDRGYSVSPNIKELAGYLLIHDIDCM